MELLRTFFDDRLTSTGLWPPHSPDLSLLDFFLWDALKEKIFHTAPRNIVDLKQKIVYEIANINELMLKKVFETY